VLMLALMEGLVHGKGVPTPTPPPPPSNGGNVPQVLDISNWKTVLIVSAHPDDIEGCIGGTVSMLTDQGTNVYYLIITNGDKGCGAPFCMNWTSQHISYQRSLEALDGAAELKVPPTQVIQLDYEDSMLTSYAEQDPRQQIVQQIRTIQPDVVLTWYPYPNFELLPSKGWDDLGYHPDHQKAGKLTLDASFDAGVPLLWPHLGPAWAISEFYFWVFTEPTYYVNISQTALDAKINAYLQHKTQYPDPEMVTEFITNITEMTANNTGIPDLTYAESFLAFF